VIEKKVKHFVHRRGRIKGSSRALCKVVRHSRKRVRKQKATTDGAGNRGEKQEGPEVEGKKKSKKRAGKGLAVFLSRIEFMRKGGKYLGGGRRHRELGCQPSRKGKTTVWGQVRDGFNGRGTMKM